MLPKRLITLTVFAALAVVHVESSYAQVWPLWDEVASHFKVKMSNEQWGQIPADLRHVSGAMGFQIEIDVHDMDLDGQFNFGFGPWFRDGENSIPSGEWGYSRSGLGVSYKQHGKSVFDVPYNLYEYNFVTAEWIGLMGGGDLQLAGGDHFRMRAFYDIPADATDIRFHFLGHDYGLPDRETAVKAHATEEANSKRQLQEKLLLAAYNLTSIDSLIKLQKFTEAIKRLDFSSEMLPLRNNEIEELRAKVHKAQRKFDGDVAVWEKAERAKHDIEELTRLEDASQSDSFSALKKVEALLSRANELDTSTRSRLQNVAANTYLSIGNHFSQSGTLGSAHSAYERALTFRPDDTHIMDLLTKNQPQHRNPIIASTMSVLIPGSGLVYSGKTTEGILALALIAGCAYWGYSDYGNYIHVQDSVASLGSRAYPGDQQKVTDAKTNILLPCVLAAGIYLYQVYASAKRAVEFNAISSDDAEYRTLISLTGDSAGHNLALNFTLHF